MTPPTLRSLQSKRLVRWALVVLLVATALGVFALSTLPPDNFDSAPDRFLGIPSDLLAHVLMYAALGGEAGMVLAAFGLLQRKAWATALLAVVGCAGYGAVLEVYQERVPGRGASVEDVIANTVGAVLGVAAVLVARRLLATRRRPASRAGS